jgi:hypothetical protein
MLWDCSTRFVYGCAAIVVLGFVACNAGGPVDESAATAQEQTAGEAEVAVTDASDGAQSRESASETQPPSNTDTKANSSTPPPSDPEVVEVTVPAGTIFELELLSPLDTSVSRVGDELQARTVAPVYLEGEPVVSKGTYVEGRVTEVQASGRVKGRAKIAFTFDKIKTNTGIQNIQTSYVGQEADSSTKKDAAVIGGGAGVGALVGGIIGGKKGAAIGAAVGGAGGTGVVLATKGEEIKLPVGTKVNVRLDSEIAVKLN